MNIEFFISNVGFLMCSVLVIPFAFVGLIFAIYKEKAAKFVSGFNFLSEKEQEMYDKAAISRDIKKQCYTWSLIMLGGSILSLIISPYMAVFAFVAFLYLVLKDAHFDTYKAFEKYLKK